MVSFVLHTLAIAALYGAGRWHERNLARRERVKARLQALEQGDLQ